MIKLKNYSKLNAPRVVTLRISKFRFIQVLIKILLEYFIFFYLGIGGIFLKIRH